MPATASSIKAVAIVNGDNINTESHKLKEKITGLSQGLHGFHIHALGDTTNGCNSTDEKSLEIMNSFIQKMQETLSSDKEDAFSRLLVARSFEHPMNELKLMPRIDSSGQVCGPTFKLTTRCKIRSTDRIQYYNVPLGRVIVLEQRESLDL